MTGLSILQDTMGIIILDTTISKMDFYRTTICAPNNELILCCIFVNLVLCLHVIVVVAICMLLLLSHMFVGHC